MMSVSISVITAVYNDAQFINKSVESILNQTYTDFEYIIVDDGSTDNTLNILKEKALQDERITIIFQKNSGAASARNNAIKASKGKYIAIQDSDDISDPNRLKLQFEHLRRSDGHLISCTGYHIIDVNDDIITTSNKTYKNINQNILNGSTAAMHPTMMFPKNLLIKAGGYNPFYSKTEDYDLILRLLENKGHIEKINKCLYNYRLHENSESSRNDGSYIARVYENHYKRLANEHENFMPIVNNYKNEKHAGLKRKAREIFYSENYHGYRKLYLRNFLKLPINNFLVFFIFSICPEPLKRIIKKFVSKRNNFYSKKGR